MKQLATSNLEFQQSVSSSNMQFQQNMTATIQDLKTQIGQLANTVSQLQSARSSNLPSQSIPNPRGNASVVTLRSGKELPQPTLQQMPRSAKADSKPNADPQSRPERTVPLPFPSRTISARKPESDEELLKMFREVEINIPLLDAIKQVPKYAKFLKELYVHKRRKTKGSREIGGLVSALTKNEELTVGTSRALPQKCRDRGIFSVPCTIGDCIFANAMLDLGASINVMPASIYRSLNFGDLEPTGMIIQLANRSIVQPLGVLEDVLVQVNELIFPADFYVLDMEEETSGKGSTLIMGRPFLMTARTKINVHVRTLSMEFGDTLVQFNIFEAIKHQPKTTPSLASIYLMRYLQPRTLRVYKGCNILEKLAGKSHYCFLDGFSGYMQIHIAPKDQHKTTFTYPFGTFAYTRMPFGLCNAPSTFQRCMTSIFSDLLQDCMEVFMDDFTVYADSFEACLSNLSKVLKRYIDTNLVLNFEKCHFMVTEGIVLGNLVSNRGIEVDKSKIDIITSLPNPTLVREVCSFLGHAGFYRRFIKNFSKLALPLSKLLQKDVEFNFDQSCREAFQELKDKLTSTPILQAPNRDLPFELMCDASNSALGAVLGQRAGVSQPVHVIAYASRTMDPAQQNYTTTEKELLAIVFALDKFRSYLLGSKIIVFSDHAALRYLLKKPDAKSRLIRWMLLLQEFDLEIRDKKGAENSVANHLSRIEKESEPMPI
ncbi:Retrovirus-related Pol polyprotein from transposon 17.6, partial [Mucuna pruriens]